MTARLLIVFLICCWRSSLIGAPADDLSSPHQEVRDAAAKILRTSYRSPSRTNWDTVLNAITNGMTETNLLKLLAPYHVTSLLGTKSTDCRNSTYRLDDGWLLSCAFLNKDDTLFERTLSPALRAVSAAPPTNFTGVWLSYFVNGQKNSEIHYENGKYHGELIVYWEDGSKCFVQHYDHHVIVGEDTGYYPSGRIRYLGQHKAGKRFGTQVGTWIWYNEDGSVQSTQDHSKQ